MTATPLAIENCWVVVSTPAAAPACSGRTCESTALISDGTISPWPIPIRAVAGAVSQPVSWPP